MAPFASLFVFENKPNPPPSKSSSIKYVISLSPVAVNCKIIFSPQIIELLGVNASTGVGFILATTNIQTYNSHDPSHAVT